MRSFSYYFNEREAEEEISKPHFLDACFLCNKQLSHKCDIFMYRGNTPFCSQECRQEQIETDELKEKRLKRSSNRSNTVKQIKESTDNKKAARTGTVAVA